MKTADALRPMKSSILAFIKPLKRKEGVIATFTPLEFGNKIQRALSKTGFQSIAIPEGGGKVATAIKESRLNQENLEQELESLESRLERWSELHGARLLGGIEMLEGDLELHTSPVRVAVSDHAFILEGWILTEMTAAVESAVGTVATLVEAEPYVAPENHGHVLREEEQPEELPPIEYTNPKMVQPWQVLVDIMGRPDYGRIDPTVFMFLTYPIFFGLMLGDMAYGIATMLMGLWIHHSFGHKQVAMRVAMILYYIGGATLFFGFIFGEFLGFTVAPSWDSDGNASTHGYLPWWVSWMTPIYESIGHHQITLPFQAVLAFPFHRVEADMMHLIVITLYLGIAHLTLGLVIGFRDVLKEHGMQAAIFEKGSWLVGLYGGFLFVYAFLNIPNHTDSAYLEILNTMRVIGLSMLLLTVPMLIIMMSKYHGLPLGISIFLGPLEGFQLLSNTLSYVRLFAVGVVGVKIAWLGNERILSAIAPTWNSIEWAAFSLGDVGSLLLIPILLIVWLVIQAFALLLGLFSPNVQTARLHFVEWMGKFYDGGGEPFKPFGRNHNLVEAE
jgi:V/A-type H+-transporting ATPase subunit I